MKRPSVLARANHLVEPALRKAVGSLDPHLRTPAEYHFGWVEPDGTPTAGGWQGRSSGPGGAGRRGRRWRSRRRRSGRGGDGADPQLLPDPRRHHGRRPHAPPPAARCGTCTESATPSSSATPCTRLAFAGAARRPAGPPRSPRRPPGRRHGGDDRRPGAGHRRSTGAAEATLAECLEMDRQQDRPRCSAESVAIGADPRRGRPRRRRRASSATAASSACRSRPSTTCSASGATPTSRASRSGNDLRERKKSLPVAIAFDADGDLADELRTAFVGQITDDAGRRGCPTSSSDRASASR